MAWKHPETNWSWQGSLYTWGYPEKKWNEGKGVKQRGMAPAWVAAIQEPPVLESREGAALLQTRD